jgi:antitoxin component YwqK of YwqJK toxin-antitoxin module
MILSQKDEQKDILFNCLIKDENNHIIALENKNKEHQFHGEYTTYDPETGCLLTKMKFNKGILEGPFMIVEKNMLRMSAFYEQGLLSGLFLLFDTENGLLLSCYHYGAGLKEGPCTDFYASGGAASTQIYSKNIKHGLGTWFYPSGLAQMRGCFVQDKKEGWWLTYDHEGAIVEKIFYKRGIQQEKESI